MQCSSNTPYHESFSSVTVSPFFTLSSSTGTLVSSACSLIDFKFSSPEGCLTWGILIVEIPPLVPLKWPTQHKNINSHWCWSDHYFYFVWRWGNTHPCTNNSSLATQDYMKKRIFNFIFEANNLPSYKGCKKYTILFTQISVTVKFMKMSSHQ